MSNAALTGVAIAAAVVGAAVLLAYIVSLFR
jgi:hypothetical protein